MFGICRDVMISLEKILKNNSGKIGRVIDLDLNRVKLFIFDFSLKNKELQKMNASSAKEFNKYVKQILKLNKAKVGIGRYNEDRIIYRHSSLFGINESKLRTIHLGIDIFLPAGTKIFSPIESRMHSFQNNKRIGDYGPTVILQHEMGGIVFYTLYGHLSEDSLKGKIEGQKILKGEIIGKVGNIKINGGWPEHLHFQIITYMKGKKGDFPGVANISEREEYLKTCPNPNLILKINNDKI